MGGILTNGVPAGPLPLTGTEEVNMDTNLTAGQNPQSGAYKPQALRSGVSAIATVATGATVTIAGTVNTEVITSGTTATLAALAVVLTPEFDGQEQGFVASPTVTTLTVTSGTNASGGTVAVVGAPTAGVASTKYTFIYKSGSWYRA